MTHKKKKKVKRPSLVQRLRDLEIRVAALELPPAFTASTCAAPMQFKWRVLHKRRRLA